MPDLVTLRQNRAKAYDNMEAILAIEDSETRQADFDAAAAEVEALDKEIANADRLQKLRGERARGTPESEGLDSVPAQGFMAKYRNLPAAYHEVPSGKALSLAQRTAFGDMLSAVMRAALWRCGPRRAPISPPSFVASLRPIAFRQSTMLIGARLWRRPTKRPWR